jgi:hypothetical protein
MTLPELIDSLIELSTEEMPQEARESLDDAIDHMVTSMTDIELNELFKKSFDKVSITNPTALHIKEDAPYLREEIREQEEIFKQVIDGNIALA